jgi:hypothetical protein
MKKKAAVRQQGANGSRYKQSMLDRWSVRASEATRGCDGGVREKLAARVIATIR